MRVSTFVKCLSAVVLLSGSEAPAASPTLELPAALERERSAYATEVSEGLAHVSRFFRTSGFDLPSQGLIESVVVFDDPVRARAYLAKEYGAPPESIPEGFSGTVEGRRLLLVSREVYRDVWSLAARFELPVLIARASEPGFAMALRPSPPTHEPTHEPPHE
jgi:hypothetical protein